jgi:hypothetical protein
MTLSPFLSDPSSALCSRAFSPEEECAGNKNLQTGKPAKSPIETQPFQSRLLLPAFRKPLPGQKPIRTCCHPVFLFADSAARSIKTVANKNRPFPGGYYFQMNGVDRCAECFSIGEVDAHVGRSSGNLDNADYGNNARDDQGDALLADEIGC